MTLSTLCLHSAAPVQEKMLCPAIFHALHSNIASLTLCTNVAGLVQRYCTPYAFKLQAQALARDEWEVFIACNPLPDVMSECAVNGFLTRGHAGANHLSAAA